MSKHPAKNQIFGALNRKQINSRLNKGSSSLKWRLKNHSTKKGVFIKLSKKIPHNSNNENNLTAEDSYISDHYLSTFHKKGLNCLWISDKVTLNNGHFSSCPVYFSFFIFRFFFLFKDYKQWKSTIRELSINNVLQYQLQKFLRPLWMRWFMWRFYSKGDYSA